MVGSDTAPARATRQATFPTDVPPEFVCELCQKQMSDPVKSVYGNVFEKNAIENWLKTQGHICPLTGAPLGDTDLSPMDELKTRIRKWILQRSMQHDGDRPSDSSVDVAPGKSQSSPQKKTGAMKADDGLYDF